MEIVRGLVETYDDANHTVSVRVEQHPGALLADIPLTRDCPAELAQPGQTLAVALWPDVGALAFAPYGGGFGWPTAGSALESGNSNIVSTAAGQELAHPSVAVTLTTVATGYFWIWLVTNWNSATARQPLGYLLAEINGTALPPLALLGVALAGKWYALPLCFRTATSYPPGTYVIKPRYHFYYAGDTTTTTSTMLSVMALPA